MKQLHDLRFPKSLASLPDGFYTRLRPSLLPDPYLVAASPAALGLIDPDQSQSQSREFLQLFFRW